MDPKTSLQLVEDASLFLPHMLFSDLAHHHPEQFHSMFALDKLNDFWLQVEKSKDDRLLGHPICLDKRQGLVKRSVQQKESTIPLFLHADGVEFQTRDSLLCCIACPATSFCVLFQKVAVWRTHGAHSWLGSSGAWKLCRKECILWLTPSTTPCQKGQCGTGFKDNH